MLSTIALLNPNGRAHHGMSRRNGGANPSQSLIKNPHCSSGTYYRTCAIIA